MKKGAEQTSNDATIELVNQISQSEYIKHRHTLVEAFIAVRQQTLNLTASLSPEDMQIQSMPDASPAKWHLAHTSWFFEAFILAKYQSDFTWHDPIYPKLYNSYYNALGEPFSRPKRGMISRPGVEEVQLYRADVTSRIIALLTNCEDVLFSEIAPLFVLGINHEQQHQELILTDIKHAMFQNPALPAVFNHTSIEPEQTQQSWLVIEGGEVEIGHTGKGFCFDNELPRHKTLLNDFEISNRLITNAEWLAFMQDGGYEKPLLWLSDGWTWKNENNIEAPLYWLQQHDQWHTFNLTGLRPIELNEAATHISYYEADAYARWAGCRLPTEQEWEHAAIQSLPQPCKLLMGSGWEWTASSYSPYPGFSPAMGNVGEYNGKFMINQMVLRGASGATQIGHNRPSYRNFFAPDARWQFSSIRLIKQ